MSWSSISRLHQICKNVHNLASVDRCLSEAPVLTHTFVRNNSPGHGQGFSYQVRDVMTRCESNMGTFGKYGQFLRPRAQCLRPSFQLGTRLQYSTQATRELKSNRMLMYLTGVVFAMVGCTYAAVPLYRRFCQATGYGGTVQRRETVEEKIARHTEAGTVTTREITVQFNADVDDGMPWKFVPTQREVKVKPGESALAFYTAENRSSTPITGISTYNVTPMQAAIYFNKIQCFCFEEQRLLPGEQIDMPVFFYIDPEFETDPKMKGINNMILSYTFFKVSEG
ncbi:hypothetical protein NMG60_11007616 [Bertholletia excelsa]